MRREMLLLVTLPASACCRHFQMTCLYNHLTGYCASCIIFIFKCNTDTFSICSTPDLVEQVQQPAYDLGYPRGKEAWKIKNTDGPKLYNTFIKIQNLTGFLHKWSLWESFYHLLVLWTVSTPPYSSVVCTWRLPCHFIQTLHDQCNHTKYQYTVAPCCDSHSLLSPSCTLLSSQTPSSALYFAAAQAMPASVLLEAWFTCLTLQPFFNILLHQHYKRFS